MSCDFNGEQFHILNLLFGNQLANLIAFNIQIFNILHVIFQVINININIMKQ
jgi:hypothetical protein